MKLNAFGSVEYREFEYSTYVETRNPAPRAGSVITYPMSDSGNVRVEKSLDKCSNARDIAVAEGSGVIEVNLDSANYETSARRYTSDGRQLRTDDGVRYYYYSSAGQRVFTTPESAFPGHELISDRSIKCNLRDLADVGLWYNRKVGKFELDTFGGGLLSTLFGDAYVKVDTRRRVPVYSNKPMRIGSFRRRIGDISTRCRDNGVTVEYERLEDVVPLGSSVEERVSKILDSHPELVPTECVMSDPSIREVLSALYDDDDHYDVRDILSYERYLSGNNELNGDPAFNIYGSALVKAVGEDGKESTRTVDRRKVSREEYDKYYAGSFRRLAKYALLVDYGWSKRKVKYTKNCKTRYKTVKEYIGPRVVVVSFSTNGAMSVQKEIDSVEKVGVGTSTRISESRRGVYQVPALDISTFVDDSDVEAAMFVEGARAYMSSGGNELDGIAPSARVYVNAFISALRAEFSEVDVMISGKTVDDVIGEFGQNSAGLSWFQYGYSIRAVISENGQPISDRSDSFWKLYDLVKDFSTALSPTGFNLVWGAQINQKPDRFTFEFIPGNRDVIAHRDMVINSPSPSPAEFLGKYHTAQAGLGSDPPIVEHDVELPSVDAVLSQFTDGIIAKVGDDYYEVSSGRAMPLYPEVYWFRNNTSAYEMMRVYAGFTGNSELARKLYSVAVVSEFGDMLESASSREFVDGIIERIPAFLEGFEVRLNDGRSILMDNSKGLYLANLVGTLDAYGRVEVSVNMKAVSGSRYVRIMGYSPTGGRMVSYIRIGDTLGDHTVVSITGNVVELSGIQGVTGYVNTLLIPADDAVPANAAELVMLDGISWPLVNCRSELLAEYVNSTDPSEATRIYDALRASFSAWINDAIENMRGMPVMYLSMSNSPVAEELASLDNEFGPIATQVVIPLERLKSLYELTETKVRISKDETVVDGDYRNLGTKVYEETISSLVTANVTSNGFDRMVMDTGVVDEFARGAGVFARPEIGDATDL